MSKTRNVVMAGMMALMTVGPAYADEHLATKQGAGVIGAAAAGGALGGPLGMVAGAAIGAWYSEQLEQAASAEADRAALEVTEARLAVTLQEQQMLVARLEMAEDANLDYAQLVLEQLQLEMLFKTDATELTPQGRHRLAKLADFLANNPAIAVRLDGYADPRGDDAYNMQLSLARVSYVMQELQALGVAAERIERFSHGAGSSEALAGDYDAYALERAVRIHLTGKPGHGYAQID
ncbi:OmpA family protein [Candidatus Litorirhabdus singularis]|nr:OmpA family protein [Candidatus Litorirhabdus singularis]